MADIVPTEDVTLLDGSKVVRQSDGSVVQTDPSGRVIAEGAAAQQALRQDQFQRDQNAAPPVPAIHPNPPEKGAIGAPVTSVGDLGFTNPEAIPADKGGTMQPPVSAPQDGAPYVTEPATSDGQPPWEIRIPPTQAPDFNKAEAAAKVAQTSATAAAEKMAGVEEQTARLKAAEEAKFQADIAIRNQAVVTAMDAKQKVIDEGAQRDIAFENELKQANAIRIDPNRYWHNKTEGQKAMTTLAGALFGFAGKGMDFLNHIDNLVQQDVKLQMEEKSMNIQNIQDRYRISHNRFDAAQRHSQDVFEERSRQVQARYVDMQHALAAIDVSQMGPAAQARKELAIASINKAYADESLKIETARATYSAHVASTVFHQSMAEQRMAQAATKPTQIDVQKQKELREMDHQWLPAVKNLAKIREMVSKYGTYEALGPHNDILTSRLDDLATSRAKIADPATAARMSEVEMQLRSMIKGGKPSASRISTLLANLDDIAQRLNERRESYYQVNQIPMPEYK